MTHLHEIEMKIERKCIFFSVGPDTPFYTSFAIFESLNSWLFGGANYYEKERCIFGTVR